MHAYTAAVCCSLIVAFSAFASGQNVEQDALTAAADKFGRILFDEMPQFDSVPGLGGVVGNDTREEVVSNAFPYSTIGHIRWGNHSVCTGALIGSNLVLTAAHCAYNKFDEQFPDGLTFTVTTNASDGSKAPKLYTAVASYLPDAFVEIPLQPCLGSVCVPQEVEANDYAVMVLGGGANSSSSSSNSSTAADDLVLQGGGGANSSSISSNSSTVEGVLAGGNSSSNSSTAAGVAAGGRFAVGFPSTTECGLATWNVTVAGYPSDKPTGSLWAANCSITLDPCNELLAKNIVDHDCDALAGQSGAPIWTTDADGTPRIIAIHVSSAGGPSGGNGALAMNSAVTANILEYVSRAANGSVEGAVTAPTSSYSSNTSTTVPLTPNSP